MRPILASACLLAASALAQTPLAFDVASIKPHPPGENNSSTQTGNGQFNATNVTMRQVILNAYGLQDFQLQGGPGWISDDRWDIQAKSLDESAAVDESKLSDPDRNLRREQMRERLRSLLAERMGLVVRRESREQTIYELQVAKSGPKLTPAANASGGVSTRGRNGQFSATFTAIDMAGLAQSLAGRVGRPVTDKTGLTGRYDFKLEWTADVGQPGADITATEPAGPTVFTALQEQLGLRLENAKGPVEFIVIEKVAKPSGN